MSVEDVEVVAVLLSLHKTREAEHVINTAGDRLPQVRLDFLPVAK